jgi:hypothetical protein
LLRVFNPLITRTASDTALSSLENLSSETESLWTSSTITRPRIFKAEESWNEKLPQSAKIILEILDTMADPSTSVSAYRRGVVDAKVDPRTQSPSSMIQEDNPISIIGFHVPSV